MKKILAVLVMMGLGMFAMAPVFANGPVIDRACNDEVDAEVRAAAGCNDVNANTDTVNSIIKGILNTVIGFVGVIAVLVIVIAGINMVVSQGDPGKVAKARNAILYAVIGLVVAILSFAIVNFVLAGVF